MLESLPEEGLNCYLQGRGLDLSGGSAFSGWNCDALPFSDSDGDVNFLSECFKGGEFSFILAPDNLRLCNPYDAFMHWIYILRSGGSIIFNGVVKESAIKRLRHMPFCDVFEVEGHTVVTKIPIEDKKRVFRHSGARGDLIYGLPCMRAMGGGDLLVSLASKAYKSAPMTSKEVDELSDVLTRLPYVDSVRVFEKGDRVDWDLNRFRKICSDYVHLARCHLLVSGVCDDLTTPWIDRELFEPHETAPIVVARSGRYHGYFDWDVLSDRQQDCVFIGTRGEYDDFKEQTSLSEIKYVVTKDILEMTNVIAGSELFIGNQSFPYAIAEAMKVPRIQEVFMDALNSLPQGKGGYTRLTSELVESIVDKKEFPDNPGRKYRMTFNENRGRARAMAMQNSFNKRPLTCLCLVCGGSRGFPKEQLEFLQEMCDTVEIGSDRDAGSWFRDKAVETDGDYILFIDARVSGVDVDVAQKVHDLMMHTKKDGLFGEMDVVDGRPCCGGSVFGASRRAYDECGVLVNGESQVEMTERYGKLKYRCFSAGTKGATR